MITDMKPSASESQRVYAMRMRPGMRWLLFSLFILGAIAALCFDFTTDHEHFWLVLIPLISGGGIVWIACFGRLPRQQTGIPDDKKTDT